MKKNMMLLTCLSLLLSFSVKSTSLAISASLVIAKSFCVINNGEPIDVDFGNEVDISMVESGKYVKDIVYTINCEGDMSDNMSISISGNKSESDDSLLATDVNGLGVQIYSNSDKIPVGAKISVTYPTLPDLKAALVKKSNTDLVEGKFSASATMILDYQ